MWISFLLRRDRKADILKRRRCEAYHEELHTGISDLCGGFYTENRTQSEKHTFGSVIYSAKEDCYYEEEPYRNIEVVDRIGSGDAYVSGALYGLLAYDLTVRKHWSMGMRQEQ